MGMYEIPRDTRGEGKILYIFSTKALAYTVVGIILGAGLKWILGFIGQFIGLYNIFNGIGIAFIILLGVAGFVIGTFKVPKMDKFEITRKVGGISIDTVIRDYIKFKLKKDKYYIYNTKDLVIEEIEKEEEMREKEQSRREEGRKEKK